MLHDPHNPVYGALNVASAASVIGTLAGWLPPVAALLGIIWYCVLLYDRFFGKPK